MWSGWRKLILVFAITALLYGTLSELGLLFAIQHAAFITGFLLFVNGAALSGVVLSSLFEYKTERMVAQREQHDQKIVSQVMSQVPTVLTGMLKKLQSEGLIHPDLDIDRMIVSGMEEPDKDETKKDEPRPPGGLH